MKLKFKQSVYVSSLDLTVHANDEHDVEHEVQAKSLVEAGFAEEVAEKQKPVKVTDKTEAPKKTSKGKKDGE